MTKLRLRKVKCLPSVSQVIIWKVQKSTIFRISLLLSDLYFSTFLIPKVVIVKFKNIFRKYNNSDQARNIPWRCCGLLPNHLNKVSPVRFLVSQCIEKLILHYTVYC